MLTIHSFTCAQVCAADQAHTVHSGLHTAHAATFAPHGPAEVTEGFEAGKAIVKLTTETIPR